MGAAGIIPAPLAPRALGRAPSRLGLRGVLLVETHFTNGTPDRSITNYMPTLVYRHDGPIWKAEAGAGYPHSKDHTAAGDRGWFAITAMTRPDVTVNSDGFDLFRPGKITVLDGGNRPPGRSIRHHQLHDHDDQRAGAQGCGCEGPPLRQPAGRFQTGRHACPHSKAAWIGNTRSGHDESFSRAYPFHVSRTGSADQQRR